MLRFCLAVLVAAAFPHLADAAPACPPIAQKPTPEEMKAGIHNARDHGFLWRISKDGHTSYLYGTIHIAKADWMYPGPSVWQALRAADTIALELDMMDPDIQKRLTRGMASMHKNALPESTAKRIAQQASLECVQYDVMAKMIPEFQVTTLTFLAARWDGLDTAYAIDAVLAGLGHGMHKNTVSLETPELQLAALQMSTPQETVAFVEEGLDEMESGRSRTLMNRMAGAWAASDFAEIEHYRDWCECYNTEIERTVMKKMLDRNTGLAESIDALHKSGNDVFAAVGSLHMFGPDGLPALMAKRGYQVEQVAFKS
jgi:uncharacterized protein YbaP (TraB family)